MSKSRYRAIWICALFTLNRDRQARTSPALWILVMLLLQKGTSMTSLSCFLVQSGSGDREACAGLLWACIAYSFTEAAFKTMNLLWIDVMLAVVACCRTFKRLSLEPAKATALPWEIPVETEEQVFV